MASTGPRSRERGKEPCSGRANNGTLLLQRGRAHVSAERRIRRAAAGVQFLASTGPRSRERGKRRNLPGDGIMGLASTGPRSRERGKLAAVDEDCITNRSFNGAALT